MSTLDDAIAIATAADAAPAPDSAPEAPASESSPAPAPAGEPEPVVPEPAPAALPADVRERLRQRREQRSEGRELDALRRELAELRAQVARPAPGGGIDPGALRTNPIAALEAAGLDPTVVLNTLSRHAIQPGTAELDARHAQTQDKVSQLEQRLERERAEAAEAARLDSQQRAHRAFAGMTGEADKFPLLAKMAPQRRALHGQRAAEELLSEGIDDFSMDDVAQLAEQNLRAEMTELLGRDPMAAPEAATPATKPEARATTITATKAAASASPPRPMTARERLEAAIAVAKR